MTQGAMPVSHPQPHPAMFNPYGARPGLPAFNRMPNPQGMAAFGAVAGNLIASGIGAVIATAVLTKPPLEMDVLISDATQEEADAAVELERQRMFEAYKAYRRKAFAINGLLATLGAAFGAYLGASPHQATNAAIGAAIGTGTIRLVNVAAAPLIGMPGWVTGGVGAYIGASRSAAPAYSVRQV